MIYGIGLPRTGTRSLAACLEILGFSGSHHCVLLGDRKSNKTDLNFIINNEFYKNLNSSEFKPSINDKYILTTRKYSDWQISISKWPSYDGPNIYRYELLVIEKFKDMNNLILFNVKDGWEPLCNFLDVDIPSVKIPIIC